MPTTKKIELTYLSNKDKLFQISIKEGKPIKLEEVPTPYQNGNLNINPPSKCFTDTKSRFVLTSTFDEGTKKYILIKVFKKKD